MSAREVAEEIAAEPTFPVLAAIKSTRSGRTLTRWSASTSPMRRPVSKATANGSHADSLRARRASLRTVRSSRYAARISPPPFFTFWKLSKKSCASVFRKRNFLFRFARKNAIFFRFWLHQR
jgi:hypothetical protein